MGLSCCRLSDLSSSSKISETISSRYSEYLLLSGDGRRRGDRCRRTVRTPRDGRDSRWERHREERRAALVDATIRAIRTHGAGVGMDDIAAEAGTSKTVIYRHFDDKAGLYRAVAERIDGRVVAQRGRGAVPVEHLAGRHARARRVHRRGLPRARRVRHRGLPVRRQPSPRRPAAGRRPGGRHRRPGHGPAHAACSSSRCARARPTLRAPAPGPSPSSARSAPSPTTGSPPQQGDRAPRAVGRRLPDRAGVARARARPRDHEHDHHDRHDHHDLLRSRPEGTRCPRLQRPPPPPPPPRPRRSSRSSTSIPSSRPPRPTDVL